MSCFYCGEEITKKLNKIFCERTNNVIYVCDECLNEVFGRQLRCQRCNNFINLRGIDVKEWALDAIFKDNNLICPYCSDNNLFSYRSDNLHSYGYKPNPHFNKFDNDDTDRLFMGCELEIGGLRSYSAVKDFCNKHYNNFFYYKEDGSISGCGCEIVTHPATLKFHESAKSGWNILFDHFNESNFVSGSQTNTGLHIHVNKNIISNEQVKKIDLLINSNDFIKKLARRDGNSYCAYRNKLHNEWGHSDSRYESVNFQNSHTVEFRLFNGTNKVEDLFASLEFVKSCIILTANILYEELYEEKEKLLNKFVKIATDNNFMYLNKLIEERIR